MKKHQQLAALIETKKLAKRRLERCDDTSEKERNRMKEVSRTIKTVLTSENSTIRPNNLIAKILFGANCGTDHIKLEYTTVQYYTNYAELQNAIAKFIPRESHRPTVELHLKGRKSKPCASLGILGGTGPLSDAAMLHKAMACLTALANNDYFDMTTVHIRLLSAPPPRTVREVLERGFQFTGYIRNFIQTKRNASSFQSSMANQRTVCLASNSAHEHLWLIKKLISGRFCIGAQDLSDEVVSYVMQSHDNPRPMILGTKAAFVSKLYPQKFVLKKGKNGKSVVPIEAEHATLDMVPVNHVVSQPATPEIFEDALAEVRSLNHQNLQAFIDYVKKFGYNEKIAEHLTKLIKHEICRQDQEPTHILLGCTELPLALGQANMGVLRTLQMPSGGKLKVIDTEDFFGEAYAQLVVQGTESKAGNVAHMELEYGSHQFQLIPEELCIS